jgi:hypothetical protein
MLNGLVCQSRVAGIHIRSYLPPNTGRTPGGAENESA